MTQTPNRGFRVVGQHRGKRKEEKKSTGTTKSNINVFEFFTADIFSRSSIFVGCFLGGTGETHQMN